MTIMSSCALFSFYSGPSIYMHDYLLGFGSDDLLSFSFFLLSGALEAALEVDLPPFLPSDFFFSGCKLNINKFPCKLVSNLKH